MSRRSKSRKKAPDLLTEVTRLGAEGATGVLTIDSEDQARCSVYVMGGDIIACNEADDTARLAALLENAGAVDASTLADVLVASAGRDLGDLLVRGKHVAGGDLMAARAQLFRDGFLWASVAIQPSLQFDPQDAVFPDNMQFGIDRDSLVDDARSWGAAVVDALALIRDPARHVVAVGERPTGVSEEAWSLLGHPIAALDLLHALGTSREAGLTQLAELLAGGALIPPGDRQDAATALQDAPALTDLPPADVTEIDHFSVADIVEVMTDDEDGPISLEADADLAEDDYERAKRGAFIKSYEVLDKVDLSGVAVLGAGDISPEIEGSPALEMGDEDDFVVALEMGDEDDAVALGDDDDAELDVVLAGIDEPPLTTAPQLARLHQEQPDAPVAGPGDDDFAMFDTGDIEEEFQVEDDSGVVPDLADDDESGILVTGDQIDLTADDEGPFLRNELADFHERIDIFNNIFRIIFRTFSEHIGPDNALQRFNALLSSNQRQYPELFADIQVADDGSVQPAPLINNLSNCTAGDYGSLLHQGLYELIFSHLYDAKDMLPGDVESGMMEQILVFERQLHQG